MKILLWVLVAFVVAMWLIHGKKQRVRTSSRARSAPVSTGAGEPMLCCAHCGTHFPASESVTAAAGKHFCCEEHRLRHSSPDAPA